MKTVYVSEDYQNNPVKFLATITDLENLLPQLNKRDDAEYLLVGLVNYRTLSQKKRIEYMSYVHNLSGNRALGIKFYELAAQQIVQPYWYAWSLTDEELRELFHFSKDISKFLTILGLSSLGSGTISARSTSDTLLDISKKGLKSALLNKTRSTLNMDLGQKISKGSGVALAFVTIFASIMYKSAQYDESRSMKELLRRGILRVSDV